MKHFTSNCSKSIKRLVLILGGSAVFLTVFYYSGLYTQFRGAMQRGWLYTGLYDAKVITTEGPTLSDDDYNMSLSKPGGEQIRLKDLKSDVLFVNFWASWCLPCIAEMPTIETLHNRISKKENIKILLISLDKEREKAIQFMQEKDFSMPYYFPASGMPKVFQSSYIPSTYVVSKEGKIVYENEGIADYSSDGFREWLIKQAR